MTRCLMLTPANFWTVISLPKGLGVLQPIEGVKLSPLSHLSSELIPRVKKFLRMFVGEMCWSRGQK